MTFWAYMLHCRGGAFYVGHTDDLERRIDDHRSGLIAGYTADHLPVEFVWSQDFASRDQAKAAEKQIKGWGRAKKLALIRGDWGLISALAKRKSGPSTSSGQTGEGVNEAPWTDQVNEQPAAALNPALPEPVEGSSFLLHPHPDHSPLAISAITVKLRQESPHWLHLRWRIEGAGQLLVPPFAGRGRADGLWRTTCFELFLKPAGGEGYLEVNLSPSERWNVYQFDTYRAGMREAPMSRDPGCTMRRGAGMAIFDAAVPTVGLPAQACAMGLSAVIEEEGGHLSYWALAHPPGKADFHAAPCFAATLAAPLAP